MPWSFPAIDWLQITTLPDLKRAIQTLLASNPAINGAVDRPTAHATIDELRSTMKSIVVKTLKNYEAYANSTDLEFAIMEEITKRLMLDHYLWRVSSCGPQPSNSIDESQIFWPRSFYAIHGNRIFAWETGKPQQDFYDAGIPGKTLGHPHPCIVAIKEGAGLYRMVPCSSRRSGGSFVVKVNFDPKLQSYAICSRDFIATWGMLDRDRGARDYMGRRISATELASVKAKVKRS